MRIKGRSEWATVLVLHSDALAAAAFLMPKEFVEVSPGNKREPTRIQMKDFLNGKIVQICRQVVGRVCRKRNAYMIPSLYSLY